MSKLDLLEWIGIHKFDLTYGAIIGATWLIGLLAICVVIGGK